MTLTNEKKSVKLKILKMFGRRRVLIPTLKTRVMMDEDKNYLTKYNSRNYKAKLHENIINLTN